MSRGSREFIAPDLPRRSRAAVVGRVCVALLSAVVLAATGYGWANYGDLPWELSTSSATDGATADGATDILLVGLDSRTDAQGRPLPDRVLRELGAGQNPASLTDTLILVHVPENGSRATAFSIPRDTYTTIPGHGEHKINSAYGRGKAAAAASLGALDGPERERRAADAGRALVTESVERLTGSQIDHYAEVNLFGFAQLTDAVGGVPVCLRRPAHDPLSGADFAAGHQRLQGAEALKFVRQRHGLPRGDLDRMVRQQAFLAGLVRTATSGGLLSQPGELRELIEAARASVVLDREWDVLTFAQRMRGIAAGDVEFSTIPIRDAAYDTRDGQAVRVDPIEVARAVQGAAHGRPAPVAAEGWEETGVPEEPDLSGDAGERTAASATGESADSSATWSSTSAEQGSAEPSATRTTAADTTGTSSSSWSTSVATSEQSRSRVTATGTTPDSGSAESESAAEAPVAPEPMAANGVHCIN
ncbi:LCP family protein [Saccharopolyspora sp. MS10]|uniref:LCP family protein n=1 Tax=Saccharopolyspora sp. MS10 TaxID=3385973 RepID=UPI0039A2BBD1